ncbi:hypothetical protein PHYBLDRAFT_151439 [Phycomyces blakesleeanus NRRL 1555(-)]|uniref:DNA replication complex GINS protein PSF3 n=1 Tax=Phycomyces blakesleeanus (strain ATCC 8743b / DSM 1359 / FGSC 10004 / NBRC 33097 / NRRL 1555) TaxID=763407 RepID=A0A162NB63_PHYB8|nr:hypothetical protein PHYBLDRAFT_151439 [Phycomyces blakesleeanus NRRL 1555(-)]OAD67534.1 hypothetical protein PHYBLDRAFT_151439 [Phycomyces blakesleeanus NRRL 1555(-)]|eukprot:XP_018285574.1 hypothetical protein PHYBLDRAFT_151439 [Phycomyces blakesleeanus NRRL 1555(-)]
MENNEYYDIDSILAEHIKIPCTLNHDLGAKVNLSGHGIEVKKATQLELPFWMAKPMAQLTLPTTNENLIALEIPSFFGRRVRNNLNASPTNVDLQSACPYFYVFGTKLVDTVVDDTLGPLMQKTYKARLREIMDHSQTSAAGAGQEFMYKSGLESANLLRQWQNRSLHKLKQVDINLRAS